MKLLMAAAALLLAGLAAAQDAPAPAPAPPVAAALRQEIAAVRRRLKLERAAESAELRDLATREQGELAAASAEPATGAEQTQRRLAVEQRYAALRKDAARRYAGERGKLEAELKADRLRLRALRPRKKAVTPS